MKSAADYRAEAAKCRALARHARDAMTANNLLALAEDYETQAALLEAGAGPKPDLPTPD
jgi:hypothetical protein